jgi:hypothetical protein
MDNKPCHFHHEKLFYIVKKNKHIVFQYKYELSYFPNRRYLTLSRVDRALRFFPKNSNSHGIGLVAL